MERVAAILAIALAAGASPVAAQTRTATTELPVIGFAPQICALQPPRLAPGAQVNFRGLSGETLQIDQMVDSTTLATNAASASLQFDAVCTFPHRLRVESQNNGLWRTTEIAPVPASGFTYAVPYRAELSWAGTNAALDADALSRRVNERRLLVEEPSAGTLQLRIVIEQGASNVRANAPLIAGYYGDTLRIVLEPQ
ncbi:hypothetical protein [Sphingomonas sp. MS122]|uniref:hypothetical protein n=1 Tax=Sphingomonas sp. MS122 TaxID=3412683 RepID=UPI003C30A56D